MARWDPFWELERFQRQMNSLLGGRLWGATTAEYPLINIAGSESEVTVTAEIPGVAQDAVDITVVGDVLTLRVKRMATEQGDYQRRERLMGEFVRSVQLPDRVQGDQANAQFSNGLLIVRMPKAPEAKPRRVEIRAE